MCRWPLRSSLTRRNLVQTHGAVDVLTGPIPYGHIFGSDHQTVPLSSFLRYMDEVQPWKPMEVSGEVPWYVFDAEAIGEDLVSQFHWPDGPHRHTHRHTDKRRHTHRHRQTQTQTHTHAGLRGALNHGRNSTYKE